MKLEKWLEAKKPKPRSKLDEHIEAIATLVKEGYTHLQIVEFLELNNVKTTRRNLSFFISQKIKNKKPESKTHQPEVFKMDKPKHKEEIVKRQPEHSREEIVEKLRKMKESEIKTDWSAKFAQILEKSKK